MVIEDYFYENMRNFLGELGIRFHEETFTHFMKFLDLARDKPRLKKVPIPFDTYQGQAERFREAHYSKIGGTN